MKTVLDDYGHRITSNQFVESWTDAFHRGKDWQRRDLGLDFAHSHGVLESRRRGEEKRVAKIILHLSVEETERIRVDRLENSPTLLELPRRYRHSIPVMRRALALGGESVDN